MVEMALVSVRPEPERDAGRAFTAEHGDLHSVEIEHRDNHRAEAACEEEACSIGVPCSTSSISLASTTGSR